MTDLLFTQANGFEDYELPECLDWHEDDKDDSVYEKRVGLRSLWVQRGSSYSDLSHRNDNFIGVQGAAECFEYTGKEEGVPRYIVRVDEGGDRFTWIAARGHGDLMALRIQLAQLMNVELIGLMKDIHLLAQRSYRVLHSEHIIDRVCRECDPIEYEAQKKEDEENRRARAAQRVFFIFNRTSGRTLVGFADDEAEAQGHLAKVQEKSPTAEMVLLIPGHYKQANEIENKFRSAKIGAAPRVGVLFQYDAALLAHINEQRARLKQVPIEYTPPQDTNTVSAN